MRKMRRIKRCIRFISEVRLVKEYKYLGTHGANHLFEGRICFYFIPITQENYNRVIIGQKYGLSYRCRKNSIKQFKER